MLNLLKFYRHFRKKRDAQALALLPIHGSHSIPEALQQYAMYRLGMYRSVTESSVVHGNWRSLFAMIVSLAACGEREKAAFLLQDESVLRVLESRKIDLSIALLAFYPELAYQLLPSKAPISLKLAVWLQQGFVDKAQQAFEQNSKILSQQSDTYLLRCNLEALSPADQLQQVNAYLGTHHLAPLVLKNPDTSLGVMNLKFTSLSLSTQGPLVSILMTTFQSAARIASSIESLLNQTYQNIELVVIDDASNDETGFIVKNIAATDPRVRYIGLPTNVGTYVAKTIGLEISQGEFVTCQDSDDWAHPEKIALQMAPLLRDRKIIFTTSNWVRLQDNGKFYARAVFPLNRLNPASPLFRKKEVRERAGFWDWVRTGADSEFHARLKLVFGPQAMQRITKPLTFGAHRADSLMTASDTGYDAHGVSRPRLDYWESWNAWHIYELRQGSLPKLPSLEAARLSHRPFEAPESIQVPPENIEQCLSILKNFYANH